MEWVTEYPTFGCDKRCDTSSALWFGAYRNVGVSAKHVSLVCVGLHTKLLHFKSMAQWCKKNSSAFGMELRLYFSNPSKCPLWKYYHGSILCLLLEAQLCYYSV